MESRFRIEHDFLGERKIPAAAYWGVHTARAVENFPISGTRISAMPDLVRALAHVKKAATRANADLGAISRERADAILAACDDIVAGHSDLEFTPVGRCRLQEHLGTLIGYKLRRRRP